MYKREWFPHVPRNAITSKPNSKSLGTSDKNMGQKSCADRQFNDAMGQVANIRPTIVHPDNSAQEDKDGSNVNIIPNSRANECLTETTDCPSEVSVLTATTTTTAGPLLSTRGGSSGKGRKGRDCSALEHASSIRNNGVTPPVNSNSSSTATFLSSSKSGKPSDQPGK